MKHNNNQLEYNIKLIQIEINKENEIKASSLTSTQNFKQQISGKINLIKQELYYLNRKIQLSDNSNHILYDIFRNNPNPILIVKDKQGNDIDAYTQKSHIRLEIRNFPTHKETIDLIHLYIRKKGYRNEMKEVYSTDSIVLYFLNEELAFYVLKVLNNQKYYNNLYSKLICTLTGPMIMNSRSKSIKNKNKSQRQRNDESFKINGFINSGVPYKSQLDYIKQEELYQIPFRIQKNIIISKN